MDEQAKTDLSSTTNISSDQTQPPAADAKSILERALLAYWEYRYVEAEELYKQVIEIDPELLSGRIWYAVLLAQQGRPGEAEAQVEQALAIDPDLATTRLNTARERYPDDEAISRLWFFLEQYRQNQETPAQNRPANFLAQAQAKAAAGDLEGAKTLFKQAVETQADNASVRCEYARFLMTGRNYLEAIDQLEKALALAPNNVEINRLLAEVKAAVEGRREARTLVQTGRDFLQAGRWAEAHRQAELALSKAPNFTEAKVLKMEAKAAQIRHAFAEADRLRGEENYIEALSTLEEIQQLLPDDEEIRKRLDEFRKEQRKLITIKRWLDEANQKATAGNIQVAFELLEKAGQLKPDSAVVNQTRQQLERIDQAFQKLTEAGRLAQTDLEAALELVEQARKLAPELNKVSTLKAEIHAKLEARRQKELEAQIEDLLGQASTIEQDGNLEKAAALCEEALKLRPEHSVASEYLKSLRDRQSQAQALLGQADRHYQEGQFSKAEQLLEQAARLNPANSDIDSLLDQVNAALLKQQEQERLEREQASRVGEYQRQAEAMEAKGEYEQAETLWAEALRLQPGDKKLRQNYDDFMERKSRREEIDETVVCAECGYPGRAGAKFCQACGKSLPHQQMCAHCNAPLRAGAKFCSVCGKSTLPEIDSGHCNSCGASLRPQARFCSICGEGIG